MVSIHLSSSSTWNRDKTTHHHEKSSHRSHQIPLSHSILLGSSIFLWPSEAFSYQNTHHLSIRFQLNPVDTWKTPSNPIIDTKLHPYHHDISNFGGEIPIYPMLKFPVLCSYHLCCCGCCLVHFSEMIIVKSKAHHLSRNSTFFPMYYLPPRFPC